MRKRIKNVEVTTSSGEILEIRNFYGFQQNLVNKRKKGFFYE